MSASRRFCLRCGKLESPEEPLIEGLCLDCFLKERRLVRLPNKVTLVRCPVCGSLYVNGSWIPLNGGDAEALQYYLTEAIIKKGPANPSLLETNAEVLDVYGGQAELLVKSSFRGRPIEQKLTILYDIVGRLCPRCLNIKARNYEAILQIRFAGSPSRELTKRITRLLGERRSICDSMTDYEELREGIDVKFSNVSVARHAATYLQSVFGGYVTESWKLYGVVKGRRHSKLAIVLRVPAFAAGDLIDLKGRLAEVLEIKKDRVTVRGLGEGGVMNLSLRSIVKEGFRVLSTADYSIIRCLITDVLDNEVVAECEDGEVIKSVALKPLKVGDTVLSLTYKDMKYLKY